MLHLKSVFFNYDIRYSKLFKLIFLHLFIFVFLIGNMNMCSHKKTQTSLIGASSCIKIDFKNIASKSGGRVYFNCFFNNAVISYMISIWDTSSPENAVRKTSKKLLILMIILNSFMEKYQCTKNDNTVRTQILRTQTTPKLDHCESVVDADCSIAESPLVRQKRKHCRT